MTKEHRLEKAGADLRAATSSMPLPTLRTRHRLRSGAIAFATGLAVALVIGIPAYLVGTTTPGGEVGIGASDSTTTTEHSETTATSPSDQASTTTTAVNSSFSCGTGLPWHVELPEDFTGPHQGPSPHSVGLIEQGQFIIHWIGREGSVEIRWPANGEYLENAEWGVPLEWNRPTSDEFVLFLYADPNPRVDDGQVEKIGAVEMLPPTEIMSGPCDAAQLTIYGPDDSRRGAAFGASEDADLIIYPNLPRPRDKVLVVGTIETSVIPEVRACEVGAPDVEEPPNRTGSTPNSPSFGTADEALQNLLSTDVAATWPKTGYFKLVIPDGTVVYGNPFDDLSLNPTPDNGLVVSVTVVQGDDGWTVTEWETSGC